MRRGEMKHRVSKEGLRCRREMNTNMPTYLMTQRKVVCKIKRSE
jgi:hypothetical protein